MSGTCVKWQSTYQTGYWMSSNSSNSCVQIDAPPPPLSAGRRSRLSPTAAEKGPVIHRTFTFRQVSGDQEAGAGLWGRRMTQLGAGCGAKRKKSPIPRAAEGPAQFCPSEVFQRRGQRQPLSRTLGSRRRSGERKEEPRILEFPATALSSHEERVSDALTNVSHFLIWLVGLAVRQPPACADPGSAAPYHHTACSLVYSAEELDGRMILRSHPPRALAMRS